MKILLIRFSSIGDIVLTTPVVRSLRHRYPEAEISFVCKPGMQQVLKGNPYLSDIFPYVPGNRESLSALKSKGFDCVVDLQKNRRSRRLCRQLGLPRHTFPKCNFRKLLLVLFKWNLMPQKHIVDRYFEAVRFLSVYPDGEGLDFFYAPEDAEMLKSYRLPADYVAVAVGSRHATKQMPAEILDAVTAGSKRPVVFLGDKDDALIVEPICLRYPDRTFNLCGKVSLGVSAACVEAASKVLTGDTGLMHIASAYRKNIVSVWGNTVPAFGMTPYLPQCPENSHIVENRHCWCRPCSKLGYKHCPLGHFRCMSALPVPAIIQLLNQDEDTSSRN